MLSVGNIGQNNYNTSFGCRKAIKSAIIETAFQDKLIKAAQKLKAGLGSKEELREVIMREEALKVGKDGIIKTILKSFKK